MCQRQRKGYVLLTTLLIIAMTTVLTVGLVRHSMNLAVASIETEERLQEKWGLASCSRFAAYKQNELLNRKVWDSKEGRWDFLPVKSSSAEFDLGSQSYFVLIEDESAKLNVNLFYQSAGRKNTISIIRELADSDGIQVKLSPLSPAQSRGAIEDAFECWSQVFQQEGMEPPASRLRDVTRNLTCWGSGLNFKTADKIVLTESLNPILGAAKATKLIRALQGSDPIADWRQELIALEATDAQKQEVGKLLVERSTCQSVWVSCFSKQRQSDRLMVQEQVANSLVRKHAFTW